MLRTGVATLGVPGFLPEVSVREVALEAIDVHCIIAG
jgi:hypothetical protein